MCGAASCGLIRKQDSACSAHGASWPLSLLDDLKWKFPALMSRKEEERTLFLPRLLVQVASKTAKSKINDSIAWTIQLLWESLPTTKPSLSPFPWNLHLCLIKLDQVQLSLLTRNFNCSQNPLKLGKKRKEGKMILSFRSQDHCLLLLFKHSHLYSKN